LIIDHQLIDQNPLSARKSKHREFVFIIIIIIHEFHRDTSFEQNFRAAMCHILHYSCNVNAAVADSLRCRMICGTVPLVCKLCDCTGPFSGCHQRV